MSSHSEIELKFLVPAAARALVVAEITRAPGSVERLTLAARYLDTEDRRLAREGIAWRVRREGRRWVQTLKARGAGALDRFEHEVARPDGTHDAAAHGDTVVGQKLERVLRDARAEGMEVGVRFQTRVRRTFRRIRTRGAVVEVAFDEGHLLAGESKLPVRELEFELVSGSVVAMLALAERWRKRFGLLYDVQSKSERGDRLALGSSYPALRKARRPEYPRRATAADAFGAVLDECLSHLVRSAGGIVAGEAALLVEHVHQMRVGIRRLRTALGSFEGWVPAPPQDLVDGLRGLFATLGQSRDGAVLDSGVATTLAKAGAPPLVVPGGAFEDPASTIRAPETQRLLLAWITWRAALEEDSARAAAPGAKPEGLRPDDPAAQSAGQGGAQVGGPVRLQATAATGAASEGGSLLIGGEQAGDGQTGSLLYGSGPSGSDQAGSEQAESQHAGSDPAGSGTGVPLPLLETHPSQDRASFRRNVKRRLRRWHRRIVADWKGFDDLDEEGLHALRKRIKRQRYAVEFFAPTLPKKQAKRYLEPLAAIQDRMGELNDLFVARTRYQDLVASDPGAWFALGWLAARITAVRAQAKPELGRLRKAKPPCP